MTREYSAFSSGFWTGETGTRMRGDPCTQVLAAYLINNRHNNMLGLYYLPLVYVTHETGLTVEQVSESMAKLEALDFCRYDARNEYVWVITAARRQVTRSPKAISGAMRELEKLPRHLPLLAEFSRFYGPDLSLLHTVSIPYQRPENTVPVGDPPVLPLTRSGSGSGPITEQVESDLTPATPSHDQAVRDGWGAAYFAANAGTPPMLVGKAMVAAVEFARRVARTHGKSLHEAAQAIAAASLVQARESKRDSVRTWGLSQIDPYAPAAGQLAPIQRRRVVDAEGV